MELFNKQQTSDEIITSRYTIVIAASKRARQLIDGAPPLIQTQSDKSVSIAVNEMYSKKLRIIPASQAENYLENNLNEEDVIKEKVSLDYDVSLVDNSNSFIQNIDDSENQNIFNEELFLEDEDNLMHNNYNEDSPF